MEPHYIAFDCEGGGKDETTTLLTVYFMILNKNLEKIDELHLLLKPKDGLYRVEAQGMSVNRINLIEHDKVAISLSEGGQLLREFLIKNSNDGKIKLVPIGHNVAYDIDMINAHLFGKKNWGDVRQL